jgi:hypothetical protein
MYGRENQTSFNGIYIYIYSPNWNSWKRVIGRSLIAKFNRGKVINYENCGMLCIEKAFVMLSR